MVRKRVDGHKFEDEFEKLLEAKYLLIRLHTPGKGYTGITQLADYIVLGNFTTLVELKETGEDRLNIRQLQQLDAIIKFNDLKQRGILSDEKEYYIIVHFINRGVIKLLKAEEAVKLFNTGKSLSYDSDIYEVKTLKQLKEDIVF